MILENNVMQPEVNHCFITEFIMYFYIYVGKSQYPEGRFQGSYTNGH